MGNVAHSMLLLSKTESLINANDITSTMVQPGTTSILTWSINRSTDLHGNYVTVTYTGGLNSESYRPDHIDYTGNTKAGLLPQRAVYFGYEDRSDFIPKYIGGFTLLQKKRLTSIQTFVSGMLVNQYKITYGNGSLRNKIQSIQACDASGICLPATTFDWGQGDGSSSPSASFEVTNVSAKNNSINDPTYNLWLGQTWDAITHCSPSGYCDSPTIIYRDLGYKTV